MLRAGCCELVEELASHSCFGGMCSCDIHSLAYIARHVYDKNVST